MINLNAIIRRPLRPVSILFRYMSSEVVESERSAMDAVEPEPKRAKLDQETAAGPASSSSSKRQQTKKKNKESSRRDRVAPRSPPPDGESKAPRLPKRQTALLLGFCGSAYRGMQYQKPPPGSPEYKTIEGELFEALVRAGAVSQDNSNDPLKVKIARAARTDAGVHAAGNIVSLKMITAIPDEQETMLERINRELPPDIRIWDFVRVQNSFNARTFCDSRKYTYFFPSYLLIPPKPDSGLDRALKRHEAPVPTIPGSEFWSQATTTGEEDMARKRAWRVTEDSMERLRSLSAKFLGTHNFHNFTVTRDARDGTNYRVIKSLTIADPAVYGGTEWISVLFHGQSFMLHQIRKMMFALVMACRTGSHERILDQLFYVSTVVSVPKMPALGLLLEYPIFDSYNGRLESVNAGLQPSDPDYRPKIDFEAHRSEMDEFKQKFIYEKMRDVEDRKGLFDAWIRSVDSYSGDDLVYFNSTGTIPIDAMITNASRRANPFKERRQFDKTSFAVDDQTKMDVEVEDDGGDDLEETATNTAETEG